MNTSIVEEGTAIFKCNVISPCVIQSFIFDKVGILKPLPDITPLESLHISIMIGAALMQLAYWDYKEYVTRHGLERHFSNE